MDRTVFGQFEGRDVEEIVLRSPAGVEISILTYGALVRDWRVPVDGTMRSVVLGFDSFEPYLTRSPFFGAICGRVANRIGGAQFDLDGVHYDLVPSEGKNQLHGGPKNFATTLWSVTALTPTSVTLALSSPDGDMGFPGNVAVEFTYRLEGHKLMLEWTARSDKPTPINLVQHNYFNLMGQGDVLDHTLEVTGTAVTELGEGQIPTGAIVPVAGTELDFSSPRPMRDQAGNAIEIDINYALPTRRNFADAVGRFRAPDASLTLEIFSDQPGLQVYNGWKIEPDTKGLHGQHYGPFSGLCLEDQIFPDAINNPHFPNSVFGPDRPYHHWCAIEIKP